jgi:hypothetical protein
VDGKDRQRPEAVMAADMVVYPDLEPYFVGIIEQFGRPPIRCYDLVSVFAQYMRDGMTFEEAVEHFEFNVRGAWVGDSTPCFLRKPNELEMFDADPDV